MSRSRVLVVDDDDSVVELIRVILGDEGFEVTTAGEGDTALRIIATQDIDLLILDLAIPGRDGFEVLEQMRQFSRVPVIILSGRLETNIKVACLGLGADDYVTKPFVREELVARCRSVIRRTGLWSRPTPLVVGDVQIDLGKRQVTVAGREVELTRHEFDLLRELVLHSDRVLEYRYLERRLWGNSETGDRDRIHQLVRRLRDKVEHGRQGSPTIVSVPSVGYVFREQSNT